MGAIAAYAAVASAGMSAYGSYASGKSQERLANRQAEIADAQAQDAIDRGQLAEERRRQQTRQQIGSQRAGFAAQGVDVNLGTPADVYSDTAAIGELDAQTIRRNAQLEAWGYKTGAQDTRARGELAAQQGTLNAAGTLLSGASRAYMYQKGGYTKAKD